MAKQVIHSPDAPAAWSKLLEADVDLINTDHLRELRDFLIAHADLYSHNSSKLPSGSAK